MDVNSKSSPCNNDSKNGHEYRIKVLFIYPPVRLIAPARIPPMGFLYMAAVLEEAGIDVEIMDINLLRHPFQRIMKELEKKKFDVIGIGGMTTVYYYIKMLSLHLKSRYPNIPIIGGGSACSASPDVVLKNTGVDVVCIGEGEPIIAELVQGLVSGGKVGHIPGIAYLDEHQTVVKTSLRARHLDLSVLPFPAYHLADMEQYITNNRIKYGDSPGLKKWVTERGIDIESATRPVFLYSKRGCPFPCNFCYRNFGRKVVYNSVDYVLEHLSFLEDHYNTASFVFGDELFNVDRRWTTEFCEKLISQNRKYVLSTGNGLRANCITVEDLRLMKKAGFYRVGIGIESFYDPSLKAMQKNQTSEQVFEAIRATQEVGMHVGSAQLLFGYESDGWESMRFNVDALTRLRLFDANFAIPCPYPGTRLYDIAVERGFITDEEGWLMELADKDISSRIINLSGISDKELCQILQWGYDKLRVNGVRVRYPVLGSLLEYVQPWMRNAFDLDSVEVLKQIRDLRLNRKKNRRSGLDKGLEEQGLNIVNEKGTSGVPDDLLEGDQYLLVEALQLLREISKKDVRNTVHIENPILSENDPGVPSSFPARG